MAPIKKRKAASSASTKDSPAAAVTAAPEEDTKATTKPTATVDTITTTISISNKSSKTTTKKAAGTAAAAASNSSTSKEGGDDERAALRAEIGFQPLTLQDIRDRIVELCRRVPRVPPDGFAVPPNQQQTQSDETADNDEATNATTTTPQPHFPNDCPYDKPSIRAWAASLQGVLEEFHLLVALVSTATYRWGTERTGAADQNLNVLGQELARSQEQILGRVSPRINDVLAPVVSVLTDKTVVTTTTTTSKKEGDSESNNNNDNNNNDNSSNAAATTTEIKTKQNYFITVPEDPDYVNLCHSAVARNATGLRQVVLANFDKLLKTVNDYLQAMATSNENAQHHRGFVY